MSKQRLVVVGRGVSKKQSMNLGDGSGFNLVQVVAAEVARPLTVERRVGMVALVILPVFHLSQ